MQLAGELARASQAAALPPNCGRARARKVRRVEERRPSEGRRGCIGLPGMMALLALWAFAGAVGGSRGFLIGIAAVVLIYLIIGAVVWAGKRRSDS